MTQERVVFTEIERSNWYLGYSNYHVTGIRKYLFTKK